MTPTPTVAYDKHVFFDLCVGDGSGESDDLFCTRRMLMRQWHRADQPVKLRRYKRCAECTAEIFQRREEAA